MTHTGTIIIDLTGNTGGDVISSLLELPFRDRCPDGKKALLKRDRPKPSLDIFLKDPQTKELFEGFWQVEFDAWWYTNFLWLCGSREQDGLFCWPCILFHTTGNMWTEGVHVDQSSLTELAKAHDITDEHKRCVATWEKERETCVLERFSKVIIYTAEIKKDKYNDLVKKNQQLFRTLIDVLMMLYDTDFACRYLLLTDTTSRRKFKTMIDLAIEQDDDLKEHCETLGDTYLNVVKFFFRDIMNCIQIELQLFITSELVSSKTHPFWSLQVDGVERGLNNGNVEHCSSIMLRYVDSRGNLQELHLGFTAKNNQSAVHLFEYLSACTKKIALNDYFVSQSYDGVCVLVDELLKLQTKVTTVASGAVLVPSIDHCVNLVLLQGITNISGIRTYVTILQDFLTNSRKNVFLYKLLQLSPSSKTHLVLECSLLRHILHERNNFIDYWEDNRCNVCEVPHEQLTQVSMFSDYLKDVKFVSFLLVFADILQATDQVTIALSKDRLNVKSCSSVTKQAILKLKQISSKQHTSDAYLVVTGSRENMPSDKIFENLVAIHNSVIENVTIQLSTRYGNSYRQLSFLSLVDSAKFETHNKHFPENALASLQRLYSKHFRMDWLKDELKIFIYSDIQFYYQSPLAIIKLLIANDMKDLLPESFKLFSLVATMPFWSATYLDNSCIERTNALLQYRPSKKLGNTSMWSELSSVIINRPTVHHMSTLDSWHNNLIKRYVTEENDYDLDLDLKE